MIKLIKNISLFTIFFIFLMIGLDVFISSRLSKSDHLGSMGYTITQSISKVINHKTAKNVIYILGSSRAELHLVPELFTDSFKMDCFNFGFPGAFYPSIDSLQELLLAFKKPTRLLFNIDIFSFQKELDKNKIGYLKNYITPFMYKTPTLFKWVDRIPLFRYFNKFNFNDIISPTFSNKSEITLLEVPKDSIAYQKLNNNRLIDGLSNVSNSFYKEDTALRNFYLNKYISIAKTNHIELIFFMGPFDVAYIKNPVFENVMKLKMDEYRKYLKTKNCLFFDYSIDTSFSNKNLFYNDSHLNKNGAYFFTNKLISDIKNYEKNNLVPHE